MASLVGPDPLASVWWSTPLQRSSRAAKNARNISTAADDDSLVEGWRLVRVHDNLRTVASIGLEYQIQPPVVVG
jgi:hypothetical protein